MTLNYLQKLAITVYFELLLVNPSMQADYIRQEFPSEVLFWDTLDSSNIELPRLVK